MLAVMFSLSGCDEKKEKPFDYDETQIVVDTMSYFVAYSDISDEYAGYYLTSGNEFEQSAIKGIQQARETDKVGEFENYNDCAEAIAYGMFDISSVDAKFEHGNDYVTVTIINNAENRDVEISIKYIENAEYYMEYNEILAGAIAYNESMGFSEEMILQATGAKKIEDVFGAQIEQDLANEGLAPYIPQEMVVTAVYSKSELMGQAAMNTLIGMGTVFVVLIFISFIISLFKYLPALFAKKPKVEEAKKQATTAPVVAAPVASKSDNLMNDAELVAVITAAIYAAAGQSGSGAVSKDRLVVRSIRRAK